MRIATTYLVVAAVLLSAGNGCKRSKKEVDVPDQPVTEEVEAVIDTVDKTAAEVVKTSVESEPDTTEIEADTLVDLPDYDLFINLLSQRRVDSLAHFCHPVKGLLISPYAFISNPLILHDSVLMQIYDSDSVVYWGDYDGSGDSIKMTFSEYFESFIYNADYLNSGDTSINRPYHFGNSLNNFNKFFPKGRYIDYHVPGTEEYGGMDWTTLRLGFERYKDTWVLVALIHDEWTI